MDKYLVSDLVAQSFLNVDFAAQFIAIMKTKGLENVAMCDFYKAFCDKNGVLQKNGENVIFTPALILGHLYVSFLLPQQEFFDSISSQKINSNEWGMKVTKGNGGDLRAVAICMRNAIAHQHFYVTKSFGFTFWDVIPPRNSISDAHTIYEFSFDGLVFEFLANWQKLIRPLLSNRLGIEKDNESK